ncbi:1,2-dihydroxy-3-keto-5-methylthiopentene dioxygenase [Methylohalomonas lacus]|uniref:Acireductone dioxygenase n=1 Tax=Methylohalomonas lacus TaxID=398773 RepID=A0AAE3HMS0_9GAMM|nr:acireductone dioxygenase [Methylohalomonas lacus]MCS3904036.1 1,2-dihydroxy-3-keto-5-methylthiopentene dioxygenase [Methylohalomonas lacus]
MTTLSIYTDNRPDEAETLTDFDAISARLRDVGIQLERWQANQPLSADADQEEVLAAYSDDIERLNRQYGFQSVDVISLRPDNPKKAEMRQKFLSEHTHDDFEVRFFVDGQGLFYLHIENKVYTVLCTRGDLISVPANTTHWFDMGTQPDFKCIRFFTTAEGWVGHFTGSDIAEHFPDFDSYVSATG